MVAERTWREAGVWAANQDRLTSPSKLSSNLNHAIALSDLSSNADKINIGVEIDRICIFVADQNIKGFGKHRRKRRYCEISHERRRTEALSGQNFSTEIGGKIGGRVYKVNRFRHVARSLKLLSR